MPVESGKMRKRGWEWVERDVSPIVTMTTRKRRRAGKDEEVGAEYEGDETPKDLRSDLGAYWAVS